MLATAASAALARVEPPTSVYQPASHYGATLEQASGLCRLHALDGQDLTVAVPAACVSEQPLPVGHSGELAELRGGAAAARFGGRVIGVPGRVSVRTSIGVEVSGLDLPEPLPDVQLVPRLMHGNSPASQSASCSRRRR